MVQFIEKLQEGDISGAAEVMWPHLFRIIVAFVIFFVGRKIIRWIRKVIVSAVTPKLEPAIAGFLQSAAGVILNLVLIFVIVEYLGFSTASLVTVLGSAGLAIGLALQGSLSNLAGGVLLLINKPFSIGDYIVVGTLEGTVKNIGVCYTKLSTPDNRVVVLPNGTLSNSNLVNVSAEPERRVDMIIPISYEDDIRSVRAMLLSFAQEQELVLKTKPVEVYTKEFGADSINLVFRFWVRRENYWPCFFDMQEKVRYGFIENGFTIPFRQVDVAIKQPAPEITKEK
ncbi:MAG: mechanosensitive ion channel [Lachnospiraceae bacterium]|nr:mechanosensitive ion channel [Lachnospiraceae bacterium]